MIVTKSQRTLNMSHSIIIIRNNFMTIRKIIEFPHPNLRLQSKPVTEFDDKLHQLVEDMFETMHKAEGIGLAAPQIDIQKQIVVIEVEIENDGSSHTEKHVLINPKIVFKEGSTGIDEGCLSVPLDYRAKVERADHIIVEYQDEQGQSKTIEARDLLAICMQHEIDHLHGTLFIDHISSLKRGLYEKKLAKYNRYKRRLENER